MVSLGARAVVAGLILAIALGGATASGKPLGRTDTRDARYCEIIVITGTLPAIKAVIWNTLGLNTCPKAWWTSLDAGGLAKEEGALAVRLNGPRHFIMDGASIRNPGPVRSFHGQKLRKVATITTNDAATLKPPPYTELVVTRKTTWIFDKGKPVRELISPDGDVYVMQAYSQIVDPTLTYSDLGRLGARLALPEGWKYQTRRLKKELNLTTKSSARILQDELQNTYQWERRVS